MTKMPKHGAPVRTRAKILDVMKASEHLRGIHELTMYRRPSSFGRFVGPLPTGEGRVWLIEHLDGKRAAYLFKEVEWFAEPAAMDTAKFDKDFNKDCDCVKCQNVRSAL